ncbi:TPM domain-containing protein [bacterium 210820-DFI.6.52]|nr:TPM domain-containing protein [bacterium 210820-DFI.6.52]
MSKHTNRTRKKGWAALALAALLLCAAPLCALAGTATGSLTKVFDQAGLFTQQERDTLTKKATETATTYHVDIAVVTTDDAGGKSAMSYADDFYDYNGIGCGEKNDGLLLLIDMDNRKVWITTTGKAIDLFTDDHIDTLLDDEVMPHMEKGDYYGAAQAFLDRASRYIKYDGGEGPFLGHPVLYTAIALGGSLLVGGIVAGCLAGSHNKLPNPAQLARAYTGTNGVRLSRKEDNFVTTHTSRTAIPKSSSSGGGGGGSSTHSGSSGVSHGGGGRSF